jgi:hypothetical protein
MSGAAIPSLEEGGRLWLRRRATIHHAVTSGHYRHPMEPDTKAALDRILETIDLTLKAVDGMRNLLLKDDPQGNEATRRDIQAAGYAWRQARDAVRE